MKSEKPSRKRRRMALPEYLEPRLPLSADGVLWGADARLTLSFAPDGTTVDGQSSQLFAKFDTLAPTDQWQNAILKGFQNWAQHTNSDIGLVADDGSEFGIAGSRHNDPRFGDVRVGSIPLGDDLFAVSVSFDELIDGTWAGELLFNSQADIQTIDQVLTIAAHEAGNIFGLEDSTDPASPLYDAAVPTSAIPTPTDIANLQSLLGSRSGDIFAIEEYETGPLGFIKLPVYKSATDVDAAAPTVAFADISAVGEVDVFEHLIEKDYASGLTIRVVTSGISQLAPSLEVRDPAGTLNISSIGQTTAGDDVVIAFSVGAGVTNLVLEVSSTEADSSGIGGYSVVISYDGLNQVSAASLDAFVHQSLRLVEIHDLKEYFEDGEQLFANDDYGSDDLPGTEVELETAPGFVDGTRFQIAASIETEGDIDRYSVVSPDSLPTGADAAVIGLHSANIGSFIGQLQVYDETGSVVPHSIIVHNEQQLLVQLSDVGLEGNYIIEVQAAPDSVSAVGGYELVAQFGTTPVERETFVSGRLRRAFGVRSHDLRVNRPQLFQFGLQASSAADHDSVLQLTIRNAADQVVLQLNTQVGDIQTASVLLDQGSYSIRVEASQIGADWKPVNYALIGAAVDDPLGPRLNDNTEDPYDFDDAGPGQFFFVTFFLR